MTAAADPSPAAVAAWGLPTAHRLPDAPLADDAFRALVSECAYERIVGLLADAVRAGAYATTDAQRAAVEIELQSWLAHACRVERIAIHTTGALDAAGIPNRLLKGIALAHLDYPTPSLRVFGDADVLVAREHFHESAAVVGRALDGRRALPELRPGWDDRFGREILMLANHLEVDLHRTFVDGALGLTIDLEELLEDPEPFRLGCTTVHALRPAARVVHAAYSAALADWPMRLAAARDLAETARRHADRTDDVIALATRWGAGAVLAHAVLKVWSTLRIVERPALVEWAERFVPTRRDRFVLAAYRGRARGYTSQAASLLVLRGVRDRAAYVRAIAFPQRAYRDARGLGRFGLVGVGARKATHG